MLNEPKPVSVTDIAAAMGRHKTNVFRDLKKRGYRIAHLRAESGQWISVLPKADADRYIAERRAETITPTYRRA